MKSYAIIERIRYGYVEGILSPGSNTSNFQTMRLKADLTLLIVSMIWGSAFVAQRIAGQMGSVYLFNGARYFLAAFVVLPFAMRAYRSSNMSISGYS
jgi:hypothetical protein